MTKWIVPMAVAAALFVVACGSSSDPVTDEGQGQDTILSDTAVADEGMPDTTVTPEVGEDTTVAQDTGNGEDTAQPDTNVAVDEGQQPDTAVGCPEGTTSGSNCWEAGACALQCEDETFRTNCFASAEQSVSDAFTAFMTCVETSECDELFAGEQISECISDACGAEVAACFVGDQECRDMWSCRTACDPVDPACPMRCFASGTADAQLAWIAYKDCIMSIECASEDVMENGWPTFTCEQNARGFCTIPYQGCFPPT